jgi:hypothetical protein
MRFGRVIAEHTATTLEYRGTSSLTNTDSLPPLSASATRESNAGKDVDWSGTE